jgi:hypothetical protein
MKARNVSVSVIDGGEELHVWGVSFTIKGSLPRQDGKVIESARRKIQKEIQRILEQVEFSDA